MMFRLLLAVSLVGAWSLPAFGMTLDFRNYEGWDMSKDIKDITRKRGGGVWHDSEGREGIFTSLYTTIATRERCVLMGSSCLDYDYSLLYRYTIRLDDGRTEWFTWCGSNTRLYGIESYTCNRTPPSSSGAVKMEFVERTSSDDGNQESTITIVEGTYTLTLVEEKIASVPRSITYPSSNLYPEDRLRDILQ